MNKPPDPFLCPPWLPSRPSLSSSATPNLYLSLLFNVNFHLHHEIATCKISFLTQPIFSQQGDCLLFSMKIDDLWLDFLQLKGRSNFFTSLPPVTSTSCRLKQRPGRCFSSFSSDQPPHLPSGRICALNGLCDGLLAVRWLLTTATSSICSVLALELR